VRVITKPSRLLILAFSVVLCAHASTSARTIDGQVFIVTAGGLAIKLALVQVAAVSQSDVQKHIADIDASLAEEREKIDATVAELTQAIQRDRRSLGPAKWAGGKGGFGWWMMEGPGRGKNGATEWPKFHAIEQRLAKNEERASEPRSRQKYLYSAAPYLADLPPAVETAKTDADGRFQLSVPDEGDYVLVASASRLVLNVTEKYCWMVKLDSRASKVTLSNDNLTTSGSSDSIVTTQY
jgi:hypothetical protein